ncbi:ExbD/TolR family protein [Jhaorihella thermophila]|uniref:Biopolymer transport protein ExbD n=1 Tax=Jhaorihella thermophila TaxID=488547 RepID=A0A1H5UNF8_9RHOB|nr:biopolymer transporter ExbD [Jhaorihella thermophila]SEF76589.1 biopolymer transport protein ExbD [Jhaorihella thermophila]
MFAFAEPRPRRRPSLTPMIDVVFLLLVFFMLASRFGHETALPLTAGGAGDVSWEGPPRLITVLPDIVTLNGGPAEIDTLAERLAPLMPEPDAPVLVRAGNGTRLARLIAVIDALRAAGLTRLVIVE